MLITIASINNSNINNSPIFVVFSQKSTQNHQISRQNTPKTTIFVSQSHSDFFSKNYGAKIQMSKNQQKTQKFIIFVPPQHNTQNTIQTARKPNKNPAKHLQSSVKSSLYKKPQKFCHGVPLYRCRGGE